MPFMQISIDLGAQDPAAAEDACFGHGALSVTLADAADHPVLEPAPGTTPLWPSVRLTALFPGDADGPALAAQLARSLSLPPERLAPEVVEDRQWEREWLKDFRPMRFGRRLWICPGGQPAPDPDALVLELDPGLAFGTGTHPTTALCLEWLDAAAPLGGTVLDYGCGSGVLALAALRLGAAGACAVDIDPQALLATRQNAARNGLEHRLTVAAAEELRGGAWDIVLANILAGPLVELAPQLAGYCRAGGDIVLAGMLEPQAEDVAAAYGPWFDMQMFSNREGWAVLSGRKRLPQAR
jgi:ribosomal protein L11 methyltransferase